MQSILDLPDAASSARTDAAVTAAVKLVEKVPGVETVIGVSGISPLDNNATLYNAGMLYVVLKDWDQRKTADLSIASISGKARAALDGLDTAVAQVMLPPPIQGVGNASGLTMMVELKDSSSDFVALQNAAQQMVENASTQSGLSASTFNSPGEAIAPGGGPREGRGPGPHHGPGVPGGGILYRLRFFSISGEISRLEYPSFLY